MLKFFMWYFYVFNIAIKHSSNVEFFYGNLTFHTKQNVNFVKVKVPSKSCEWDCTQEIDTFMRQFFLCYQNKIFINQMEESAKKEETFNTAPQKWIEKLFRLNRFFQFKSLSHQAVQHIMHLLQRHFLIRWWRRVFDNIIVAIIKKGKSVWWKLTYELSHLNLNTQTQIAFTFHSFHNAVEKY